MKSPILIEKKTTFSISSLNCNHSTCQASPSELHNGITLAIKESILSKGHQVIDMKADYRLVLVSAFEGDIEHHTPRNLYLVIRNKEGRELGQIAVAESFSSPLDQKHVDIKEVKRRIVSGFNDLMSDGAVVTSTTN